jgi:hypothetical protein
MSGMPIKHINAGTKAAEKRPSERFNAFQIQLLALLHHMAELLAAARARLPQGVLPFPAENPAALAAAQAQRQLGDFQPRASWAYL